MMLFLPKRGIVLVLYLMFCLCTSAQNIFSEELNNLSVVDNLNADKLHHSSYKGVLWFYKRFISSQQPKNTCVFAESCSVFSSNRIRKKGWIMGIFATTDRLCRCHLMETSYYNWNDEVGKLEDIE